MDPYLGELKLLPVNFAPRTWAMCNGQTLPINQNAALYSLLGTQFGGDSQNFKLPDLRGRTPIHRTSSDVSQGSYTVGGATGLEQVTLQLAQMPGHTHQAVGSLLQGDAGGPGGTGTKVFAVDQADDVNSYSSASPNVALATGAMSLTGGNQAHNNMQPYLTLTWCICINGLYPPRPY